MTIEARFHIRHGDFSLDAQFDLPGRGVTALFGPSGSGKTSLLRAIAGLDRIRDGVLRVGDAVWQDDRTYLPPHHRPVGYVFQDGALFEHLTVRRNLNYGHQRVPPGRRRIDLDPLVEMLGIAPLLDRASSGLSGGERQRVAIARALAVSPDLLLMDEPLTGLDHDRKQEFLPYLESLHRELSIPVLYVSHAADEVLRLADTLVLLDGGRVRATGPLPELLTRFDLPLAHRPDAEVAIEATVAAHDPAYGLTSLDSPAGRFTVLHLDRPAGSPVRLRIAARDVSITLSAPSETSIQNTLPAVVKALEPKGNAEVTVVLQVGAAPVLARITRKSADILELRPDAPVYAQVKSIALV